MSCNAMLAAVARQGDACSSSSSSLFRAVASMAAGVGVAAFTTGMCLASSKRVVEYRNSWSLRGSFGSDRSSSSCPTLASCGKQGSSDSSLADSVLRRCASSMDEELCIKSEPNPESRAVLLEDESMSEPSTPGFAVNTPDPSEAPVPRCGRRISLDDRRIGMVSETGVLERVQGFPDDWLPWQLDPDAIEFCKGPNGEAVSLGKGAFGQVNLARMNRVIPVAVKSMKANLVGAVREVALLRALANTNIVQFQGACLKGEELLLVTEFMEGGDLLKAIRKKAVNWHHRGGQIAMDVARGLHFLHSNRVVHLDLKSPNILLTRHGVAKIGDVGMARITQRGVRSLDRADLSEHACGGTFAWAAPELLMAGLATCSDKADIFSFGVVLWEIVTGEAPVRGRMRDVRCPEDCPREVANLIDACMHFDPDSRPSAIEAFEILRRVVRCEQRNSCHSNPRTTKSIDIPRTSCRPPSTLKHSLSRGAARPTSLAQFHNGRAAAARAAFGLQNVEEGNEKPVLLAARPPKPQPSRLSRDSGSFSCLKRSDSCPMLGAIQGADHDADGSAAALPPPTSP